MTILISWVAPIAVLFTFWITKTPLSHLGFRLPSSHIFNVTPLLYTIANISVLLYILVLATAAILFRLYPKLKKGYVAKIPSIFIPLLPRNSSERRLWIVLSLTAGITEEILFRGYLFFIIPLLFKTTTLWPAAILSTTLFAIGHLYQKWEALKPLVVGALFTFIYYSTGSLLWIVILHTLQDAFAVGMLREESQRDSLKGDDTP